jgi:uncharacterized protein (TIGR00730 family)
MGGDGERIVVLFGSYSPRPGERLYALAYEIGRGLAEAGYVVCNGGYDGTMEASAKGAKDAGGRTIGVTCDVFSDYRGVALTANRYIDREVRHDNVLTRIADMMAMGCAYVVMPGGTGTLSELAIVWEYVCKGLLDRRPIVLVGDFWRPVVECVRATRPKSAAYVQIVHEARDVVAAIRSAEGGCVDLV